MNSNPGNDTNPLTDLDKLREDIENEELLEAEGATPPPNQEPDNTFRMHDDDPNAYGKVAVFAFDEPAIVPLKNGTSHLFHIPSFQSEMTREAMSPTTIITSPARVEGSNPREVNTEFTKGLLRYYRDNIDMVLGYATGDDMAIANEFQSANAPIPNSGNPPVLIKDAIPVGHRRTAASLLYTGRVEVMTDELDEGETRVHLLRTKPTFKIKQELGIQTNDDGTFSDPTAIIIYEMREPDATALSRWETQAFNGQSIVLKSGGTRETRTYNLKTMDKLFNSLIVGITGAGIKRDAGGTLQMVDVSNPTHLELIPVAIKKLVTSVFLGHVTSEEGN